MTEPSAATDLRASPTLGNHLIQLLIGLVVILCIGCTVLTWVVNDLHGDVQTLEAGQLAGKERTFKSQALSCSIKLAIGGDVSQDAACQTPEVLALYDEHAERVVDGLSEVVEDAG